MMTNSNADGVDKVLASRGTYVYIMESGSVDYEVLESRYYQSIQRYLFCVDFFYIPQRSCG